MLMARLNLLWTELRPWLSGGAEARRQGAAAQAALDRQKQHLLGAQEATTNLIFQRKRLKDRLQTLDDGLIALRTGAQEAARDDQDAAALQMLAKLEAAEEERRLLTAQAAQLEGEVATARRTERELACELDRSGKLMTDLQARHHNPRERRRLLAELEAGVARSIEGARQMSRERRTNELAAVRVRPTKGRHEQALGRLKDAMRRHRPIAARVAAETAP